ncbi:MAG TPA: DNA polymerase III subunit beta [Edaphocola sp.]|nr:DNA polymerase III subunit beta [Edaphocola sp.]
MDFIVSSGALLKNLQLVGGIISTNVVVPILENFLFELKGNTLTITGSDMETMIKASMEVQSENSEESGSQLICVPSKIFMDYLKNLPEQPLHIKTHPEDFSIEISSNSGKYKIGGENGREYPKEAEAEDLNTFSIPSSILTEAISKTIFATSTDNLRPAMTGVFFELNEEGITFVATDGHRLVKITRTDIDCPNEGGIIAPRKPLQHLKNILPDDDSLLKLSYNKTHLFVENNQIKLNCRLIDGKFPPYRAVIPAENPYALLVNRPDLISCLRRVSIFASKSTQQIVFDIVGSTINISGQDLDFSFEGKETLACQFNGPDMRIGFNGKLLIEMLNNISGDDLKLELSTPSRAGIYKPAEQPENTDLLMLLMPLMVGLDNND